MRDPSPVRLPAALAMVMMLGGVSALGAPRSEGDELIGKPAPAWRELAWLAGGPLKLEALRGKAVLIRFWTVGCALCTRTAPALNEVWEKYRDRGLVVVGIHHPKSEEA